MNLKNLLQKSLTYRLDLDQSLKIWKDSDIIPIPKKQQPTCEEETKPISLTFCLCKVLEDFIVSWMISDIGDKIDHPRQFGCLKGTSTYCLLDMIETWLSFLDGHSRHLRICFLDFAKAFDRTGHNVAVTKLLNVGVRRSLIHGLLIFLRIAKIGLNCQSLFQIGYQVQLVHHKGLSLDQFYSW